MATIKDIAQKLGISPSTVSIVLRGNGPQRNISQATIDKVLDCARELKYQPNIVAKRLREINSPATYTIAVFWTSDFRAPMMVRFLKGLQDAISKSDESIEIFVRQYENNALDQTLTAGLLNMFHGAIVCNASEKDIEYIEHATFLKPIVLYNRHSPKYSAVCIDNRRIGCLAAREFHRHACKSTCVVTSESVFAGMLKRTDSFIEESRSLSIQVIDTIQVTNSIRGGNDGGQQLLNLPSLPDSVFCASDAIALGVLYALNHASVRIPEQLKLISIGNGDKESEEFSTPSLSVIYIPIEEMAEQCLLLLMEQLPLGIATGCREIKLDVPYIARMSCPPTTT